MKITNSQKKIYQSSANVLFTEKKKREGIKDKLGENSKSITEIGK